MRILVVGSGGREHALGWALSHGGSELYFAPGNPGTKDLGFNIAIPSDDVGQLVQWARDEAIDLTVVGPEIPLVAGIADTFKEAGLHIVGPVAAAATIEGSKAFAKAFMARHSIPTASFQVFEADQHEAAQHYLQHHGAPIVIKASGLAAGKGALVCKTLEQGTVALDRMMRQHAFGDAASEVIIEDFLEGEEASVFVLTDGDDYICLPLAQDHKRIGEGDTGPNTGGMGAYAPAPVVDDALLERVRQTIIEPTLEGMATEGRLYQGCLYVGLMITTSGPQVVEFNCRLGDPEAQVVLPLLDIDATELMMAVAEERLGNTRVKCSSGAAACVVLASGGYPGSYRKGLPITGLTEASEQALVFHAGTAMADGSDTEHVVTAGGRVLGITGQGRDLKSALNGAYSAAAEIRFDGLTLRSDIGWRGLAHMQQKR